MDQFFIKDDMKKVHYKVWDDVQNPKAMIQIAHGMSEHIERYNGLAEFLNENGFLVFGNNHRGHGPYSNEPLGYFGKEDGWNKVLEDMNTVNELMTEKHPNLPKFILGHSMGSFLTRYFINRYGDDFNGAILVGSAFEGTIREKGALILIKLNQLIHEPMHRSKFVNDMFNNTMNSQIKDAEHRLAWVNSQDSEVKIYSEDPYCGFDMTDKFYIDLLNALIHINDEENINNLTSIPILILGGAEDPVGNMGKDLIKLNDFYLSRGVHSDLILYPGMRHEILREKNKEQVFEDILRFIHTNI